MDSILPFYYKINEHFITVMVVLLFLIFFIATITTIKKCKIFMLSRFIELLYLKH